MKRDFLRFMDLNKEEVLSLLDRAIELKSGVDINACPLIGQSIGMLFEKPSTRTRISFEVAIYQLGGQPVYMTPSEIQLSRGETIEDTARVLSRYLKAVVIRTFEQDRIERFAKASTVPVINALTDSHHPCQALADLMTIKERFSDLGKVKVAYVGDGNNVANSLVEAATVVGFSLLIACPEGYEPSPEVLDQAHEAGAKVVIVRDPREAVAGADVVYTDVWVSMGQEQQKQEKLQKFRPYQINESLLKCAREDTIVMHCLPAHRGQEITDAVIDGPQSVVFDQAENRLHAQKALLEWLLSTKG